ncbi:PIN domain-containing protein [Glycomyces endophyticus]|uniref:PIN domain-containing protein n=1 Tax=Glycomyces endophyticus TaxID=480996 RepID=A0ABP4TL98_9ACTN
MIVADTSAVVEFLLARDELGFRARNVLGGKTVAVPMAIDLECVAVLRGLVLGRKVTVVDAEESLETLGQMDLRRMDHSLFMPRVWELRDNMWPYDAIFVAMAEILDAPLVTTDKKFAGTPGIRCEVRNLRD